MLAYQGPSVRIDDVSSNKGREVKTLIRLSQDIIPERDLRCKNYPYNHFKKYKDCDEEFVMKEVKLRRNVTPVWATTDLESVTKLYHVDGSELMMSYFFQGALVSSCYKPCVSTKVKLDFGII